jgi:hypothetical protein
MSPTPFDLELAILDLDREVLRLRQWLYRYLHDSLSVPPDAAGYICRYLRCHHPTLTQVQQARVTTRIKLIKAAADKRRSLI